jgi:hypothetical protein
MTFFLKEAPTEPMAARGPDIAPQSSGIGSLFQKVQLESDTNMRARREEIRERDTVARSTAHTLGPDGMRRVVEEHNAKAREMGMPSREIDPSLSPDEIVDALGPNGAKRLMEVAQEEAKKDPTTWKDIDATEEGVQQRVNARLQAEYEELNDLIAMSPQMGALTQFIVGAAAVTADFKNIPFLFAGGAPGTILKVMGREAAINTAAEAAFLPSQFDMAERLNIEAPDVMQTLGMAAVGGAAFGGAFEAVTRAPSAFQRGMEYYRARTATPVPEGVDPAAAEAATEAAELAILNGEDPVQAAATVTNDWAMGEGPVVGNATEDDLFGGPAREPLIPVDVSKTPARDTQTDLSAVVAPQTDAELAQEAVDMLKATDDKRSRPLTAFIKRGQSDWKGIDPNGPFGQELKARGVNARTYPGLFRKGGRGDLDNLVASEMEESFPGISAAAGVDGIYLDRNGLLEVVIRDAQGDASWLQTRAALAQAEREAAQLENPTRPADDFVAGERADDGFFVNLDDYEFGGGDVAAAVGRDFDAYVTRKGITLLPREREEILTELQARGGDAEYLVERALERELDDLEYLALRGEQTDGNSIGNGGGAPQGEPGPRAGALGQPQAGPGAAAPDRAAGGQPAISERTAAGDQLLIAGVGPISERQRLEAAQQKRMGGGQQSPDADIGGMFDTRMGDLFDSVSSPKAQEFNNATVANLRQTLDDARAADPEADIDMELTLDDGRTLTGLSEILDEIDELDAISREIELCRIGKATPDGNSAPNL